ncbi:hypothetical protein BB559_006039 [Furculomyces boomerangus]|uniref:Checkpoint protein n=1 Tax=Furculomyces boomerangus TaxID=61424 RepID=A0A2T9Y535_9FUNG|nr:hypothetical protein BB559_006039 [Furculomyces boomerangus]
MKFKAQLQHNNILQRVVQSLEKLGKMAVLQLSSDHIKFIHLGESDSGFQLFAQDNIFMDVVIESANENKIFIEIQIENLQRALKSCQGAENVTIRLIKKQKHPILSFLSRAGRPLLITQDIPIRVLTPAQMNHVKEPILPAAQVCILLPQINSIRSVAERMKTVSDYITISANNSGNMTLRVASEIVEIETYYKQLVNPQLRKSSKDEFENEEEYNEHLTRPFSCSISMKNFIKFLYAHYIVPTSIVCIIIEQHAVIFTVYISSTAIGAHFEDQSNACGAMTYYIPAHLK